jgi:hypothetical protein
MEIHKGIYWYSTDPSSNTGMVAVPIDKVAEIQKLNRQGKKIERLSGYGEKENEGAEVTHDLLRNNSLTRFDAPDKHGRHRSHSKKRKNKKPHERKD